MLRGAIFFTIILFASVALAGTIQSNGSAIIIGPDAQWTPGDACNGITSKAAYLDCLHQEAEADMQAVQKNVDASLQRIQDQQQDELYEVHKQNQGAINKLNGQNTAR